jgi:hypothetical protein
MTYTKPEVHEIGSATQMIKGPWAVGGDLAQGLPTDLALEDIGE